MNDSGEPDGALSKVTRQQRVHELLARFESTLNSGAPLRIEDFQEFVAVADRDALAKSLSDVERAERERVAAQTTIHADSGPSGERAQDFRATGQEEEQERAEARSTLQALGPGLSHGASARSDEQQSGPPGARALRSTRGPDQLCIPAPVPRHWEKSKNQASCARTVAARSVL